MGLAFLDVLGNNEGRLREKGKKPLFLLHGSGVKGINVKLLEDLVLSIVTT